MCLGLPGQIVDVDGVDAHRATVDVSGVQRAVNIGLIVTEGESVSVGEWVLVHVGFAMSKIDEEEARQTLDFVRELGSAYDDEIADFGRPTG
ncbi:MAG: HypC/HybG/HupF family hydrogenase formation chaperone [Iamia sp.]